MKVFFCNNCLNTSTRPRITFDKRGWCNACQWMEEKKHLNWNLRKKQLFKILNQNKKKNNAFDCIVPVSGGKDGSYISHQLKEYGYNPLTVTTRPNLEFELGKRNLLNFISSGFNHIHISPSANIMQELNKLGFIHQGFPYYGWLTSVFSSILRIAVYFNINLIVYGEDGEVEYGGSNKTKNKPFFNVKYEKKIYLDGGHEKILKKSCYDKKSTFLFRFPPDNLIKNIQITHWSYFESWDPYRNYLIAKKHCGLEENKYANEGTFTNFAQNDQSLYALHTYLMFLKFGFGRATQDVGIEIRRGSMTRDQGINLVKLYDGIFPEEFMDSYLDYYEMNKKEFFKIIDKWANKKILKKINNKWVRNFDIV